MHAKIFRNRSLPAIGTALLITAASLAPAAATTAPALRSAQIPAPSPVGNPSESSVGNPAGTPQKLDWAACPFPESPDELQCASILVPVDYANPRGPQTWVTMNRLPATGAHPIGSLFFNPGGPGGSGTEVVYGEAVGANFFTASTRDNFDLIGFDPRGVGLSNPVKCDPELLNRPVSLFPKDEAGFARLVAKNQALGRSCRQLTG